MADRQTRFRHEDYRPSRNGRSFRDVRENGDRYHSRNQRSSIREDRNRYYAGGNRNDNNHGRDDREDRQMYDNRRYRGDRRGRQLFERDDRRSLTRTDDIDAKQGYSKRLELNDRRSLSEEDGNTNRRDIRDRQTHRHSTDRNCVRSNNTDRWYGSLQANNQRVTLDRRGGREKMVFQPPVLNFKFLNELQKQEPFEILMTLANPETGLRDEVIQLFRRPFVARLLLSVLVKAFTCTSALDKLHDVFEILKSGKFIDKTMDFFLQMKDEDRIHEQATFRQSIVDMFSIMKEMDSFEKCRLSKTEFKGVKAILTSVIEYLKENTNDVIDDEVVNAFREFTEKSDRLTNGEKRGQNDMQDGGVVDVPPKKSRDIQTSSNSNVVQCLLSSSINKVETSNSQQGSTSSDTTEPECKHILDCGHKCQAQYYMPHTEVCDIDVEKTFPCGHIGNIECYKKDSAMCQEPCGGILACEHPCKGTCAECFQGRLHKPCEKKCKRILVCDHECTKTCNECLPCERKCENRCQHSKCIKQCGELCVPCKEKCTWNCEHFQCGKLCSEPCDRARCDQPCQKRLACGHQCIGLCGEPCPSDCRVCNKEKVIELFFGSEGEPGAKFIMLEDCRAKCILESDGMDYYMDEKNDDVNIKLIKCPKCETPIRKSNRYRHIINKTLLDIEKVKEKKLSDKGHVKELENKIRQALLEVQDKTIEQSVKQKIRAMKNLKSENTLVAMLNQLSLLKAILKLAKEWKDQVQRENLKDDLETALEFLQRFQYWVMQDRSFMTEEELSDAKLEISRSYHLKKLLLYKQQATDIGQDIDSSLQAKISETESLLKGSRKYEQQVRSTVESCLKELKDALPQSGLGVSEEEKIMIVKAMDFKQKGHWYKCPNGHIYVISECGGAMEESRCPECNSGIGGERHQLRDDNQVATEMDGARFGAWSEQANMENYDQFELFD